MNEDSVCPIWGTTATVRNKSRGLVVDSPRAGGRYFVSRGAEINLKYNEDELQRTGSFEDGWNHAGGRPSEVERLKARLTSWLVEQRRLGVRCPEITQKTIEEVGRRQNLTVHERADRLLQSIQRATPRIGEHVGVFGNVDAILAVSESTNDHEVSFLLEYLERRGWLEKYGLENRILTVEGYARLAELEKVAVDSSQAFVAMWFDESMDDVYQNGIEPGIRDAGYNPLPINKKEHINKIDDEIIAEIRRSRFVVADFTHGDTGARGGVYYEAGFAHGLNIPVIFTCREDILMDIHFDTRQYNHIAWDSGKLEEFRKELADRISAVIGDGPNKNKNNEQDS